MKHTTTHVPITSPYRTPSPVPPVERFAADSVAAPMDAMRPKAWHEVFAEVSEKQHMLMLEEVRQIEQRIVRLERVVFLLAFAFAALHAARFLQ